YSIDKRVKNSDISYHVNDPDHPVIYTLSLHDALPIFGGDDFDEAILGVALSKLGIAALTAPERDALLEVCRNQKEAVTPNTRRLDRKSTRLNSSHSQTSYAVFRLKKQPTRSSHGPAQR